MKNKIIVFSLLLLCFLYGCKKEKFAPHVEITEILDVSYDSGVLAVKVDEAVFKDMTPNDLVGVRCAWEPDSEIDDYNYYSNNYYADWDEAADNVFVVRLEYCYFSNWYIRPFVVLGGKFYYGDEEILIQHPQDQFIYTHDVEEVTATSAVCGGEVVAVEGVELVERGVCWGTERYPKLEDNPYTVDGNGAGVFTSHLTGLTEGEEYYVRAYSKTSYGTVYYGEEKSFLAGDVPAIITGEVTVVSSYLARVKSTIVSEGTFYPIYRGACWGTEPNPTVEGSDYTMHTWFYPQEEDLITDLKPNTTYYVRAFAENKIGIGYGEQQVFTTNGGSGAF